MQWTLARNRSLLDLFNHNQQRAGVVANTGDLSKAPLGQYFMLP